MGCALTIAAAVAAVALVSWVAFVVASRVMDEREIGELWREVEEMRREGDGRKDEGVHGQVS